MPILVDFKAKNCICSPLPISICYPGLYNRSENDRGDNSYEGAGDVDSTRAYPRSQIFSTFEDVIEQLENERLRREQSEESHGNKTEHSNSSANADHNHAYSKHKDAKHHPPRTRKQKKYRFIYPYFILETWVETPRDVEKESQMDKDKVFDGGKQNNIN
ncbi:hypothetical protein RFI_22783 [Reticulomyxa filosa]|uniref:Uncharacterized protein n=1 Tax=Reticulomyxa filosa TaxID=46433 RepID=X6MMC3_RETFI|nr:hypothetical protein RFI_22783 [Reticulomyxa filosa]|eukprot:ETO14587.1 hypothetical protein RFI_22783 [Reticulomyxa filosa]